MPLIRRCSSQQLTNGAGAGDDPADLGHVDLPNDDRDSIIAQGHDHATAAAKVQVTSYISAELSDNRGRDAEKPVGQVLSIAR